MSCKTSGAVAGQVRSLNVKNRAASVGTLEKTDIAVHHGTPQCVVCVPGHSPPDVPASHPIFPHTSSAISDINLAVAVWRSYAYRAACGRGR